MRKTLFLLLGLVVISFSSFAQTWSSGDEGLYNNPLSTKIGIGTTVPHQALHVVNGNILISKTSTNMAFSPEINTNAHLMDTTYSSIPPIMRAPGSTNGSILFGANISPTSPFGTWGIEYDDGNIVPGLNFWRPWAANFILFLANNGNVGIGTNNPQQKLVVNGNICAKEVRVSLSGSPCWPDYVFSDDYTLMSLQETEQYIKENQHLPDVPSAKLVEENGVQLGEISAILLKKIEELTLHIIELEKQIKELKQTSK